jgi:HEPN domain-containing protein
MLNLGLWYSSKAKLYLREAEKHFRQYRYPESMSSFQKSIEFAAKAICEFFNENYSEGNKYPHDVSDALERLAVRTPTYKEDFSRAALVSSRWVGMKQKGKMLIEYGNQKAGVPATKIVRKNDVELIRDNAREICELLNSIELQIKMGEKPS